eukprot:1022350-Rhodomonas_salina.1
MQMALAFAAVDDRLGGKPVLAYFSSSEMDLSLKGIATIASIEEVRMGPDGEIESAVIVGVGRAVCPRVRAVEGKSLLIAHKWRQLQDVPPAARCAVYMFDAVLFLFDAPDNAVFPAHAPADRLSCAPCGC